MSQFIATISDTLGWQEFDEDGDARDNIDPIVCSLAVQLLGANLGGGPTSKLAISRSLSQLHQALVFWSPSIAHTLQEAEVLPELYASAWVQSAWADILPPHASMSLWQSAVASSKECNAPAGRFLDLFTVAILVSKRREF